MKKHVNKICSEGYLKLRNLWHIGSKLAVDIKKQLVHSCILSRIDYCNSLLFGASNCDIAKLQRLMNAAVCFIYNLRGKRRKYSITPFLKKLHFLPVKYRITYKIALFVFKCLNGLSPDYLSQLICLRTPLKPLDNVLADTDIQTMQARPLNDFFLLKHPPLERIEYKQHRFTYAAPEVWNKLPYSIRTLSSLELFKRHLKTHLFQDFCRDL